MSSVNGIEFMFVEIRYWLIKVLIACVYLQYPSVLLKELKRKLQIYVPIDEDIIMMCDFNIDIISSDSIKRHYIDMLDQFSLCVMNSVEPTHFTSDSSTLIGHIIVRSDKCANVSVCYQISGVSAHDLVYISYVVDFPQDFDQSYEYRCINI